uniref:Reverse transcriptase domain-containing protein n=1 Tax=Cacopsylla melanoneura TaxID=428564 RepID=A0A8D8VI75_9HEMI
MSMMKFAPFYLVFQSFSLAIHPIVRSLQSELNLFYLDDGIIGGSPETVLSDIQILLEESAKIGLEINPRKCELFFPSGNDYNIIQQRFEDLLPGVHLVSSENLSLLGAPLVHEGYEKKVEDKLTKMKNIFEKLKDIPAHFALHLMKNCLGIPKLLYILRTVPTWKGIDILNRMDLTLKSTLEDLLNVKLNEKEWKQANLPIRHGGLGIRSIIDLSLPAFLASCSCVKVNVSNMLNTSVDKLTLPHEMEAMDLWNSKFDAVPVEFPNFQKKWDDICVRKKVSEMKFDNAVNTARFLALQEKESNVWLQVIPG